MSVTEIDGGLSIGKSFTGVVDWVSYDRPPQVRVSLVGIEETEIISHLTGSDKHNGYLVTAFSGDQNMTKMPSKRLKRGDRLEVTLWPNGLQYQEVKIAEPEPVGA